MSLFDWVFPLILIQSVVRQLRGKHLSAFGVAWPIAIAIWAAVTYVRGFPAHGADLALVIGCVVAAGVLGILAGRSTSVYRRGDGRLMARSTAATVAYWTLGTIGRLVFGLYGTNGGVLRSSASVPATGSPSALRPLNSSSWPSRRSPAGVPFPSPERFARSDTPDAGVSSAASEPAVEEP